VGVEVAPKPFVLKLLEIRAIFSSRPQSAQGNGYLLMYACPARLGTVEVRFLTRLHGSIQMRDRKVISSIAKSAEEVSGFEYDWLGCDESGCVALFSTAGAGYAPKAFLRDTDAHDEAIQAVLALAGSTDAEFFPELPPGATNTWRLVAERGLYAYDCNPNGGPYRLVASPATPMLIGSLPVVVAEVAIPLASALLFRTQRTVSSEMLQDHDV
jgi:hypothetical protein